MNGSATIGSLISVKERDHIRHFSKCGKVAFDAATHSMYATAHLTADADEAGSDQPGGRGT
jgi:hypothetical protein